MSNSKKPLSLDFAKNYKRKLERKKDKKNKWEGKLKSTNLRETAQGRVLEVILRKRDNGKEKREKDKT